MNLTPSVRFPNPLWQKTMKEELDALIKIGTWDLVDLTTENVL